MPLPIKVAVHRDDRHPVRAVLATASIRAEDIDNLIDAPVNADVRVAGTPPYVNVAFFHVPLGQLPRRRTVGATAPAYLLWDGADLYAVTPREFAREYEVVVLHRPEPPVSHHYG